MTERWLANTKQDLELLKQVKRGGLLDWPRVHVILIRAMRTMIDDPGAKTRIRNLMNTVGVKSRDNYRFYIIGLTKIYDEIRIDWLSARCFLACRTI
jgi:hypothetical protein